MLWRLFVEILCFALHSNSDCKEQESNGKCHQNQLEQNCLFEPSAKALVGKAKTNQQRSASGDQNVCVAIGKEVGHQNYVCGKTFDGGKGKHWDDQNCFGGCAWDEELQHKNKCV